MRVLRPGGLIGVRDADWGGVLVHPSDAVVDGALAQFSAAIRNSGGDPEIGRRLGGILKEAGFGAIRMTASYEVYDPAVAALYLSRLTGGHAIGSGLFLAQPWCEAVGTK